MKMARILCLFVICLMALAPAHAVFAQQPMLTVKPHDGRYNTEIVAGNEYPFTFDIENTGTQAISNATFSADFPGGWTVKFDPAGFATVNAFEKKRVDANITVPKDTTAGDYIVTIKVTAAGVPEVKMDIRVTVRVPVVEPKVEMRALYPTLSGIAGEQLVFEVEFLYTAASLTAEPITLNLSTKAPPKWTIEMTPPYEKEKKLSAITLKPGFTFGDKIRVAVTPPFLPLPEPGEYPITLTADSGQFHATINLKAVITARYNLTLIPSNERYNMKARAGRENAFSIEVGNMGTAPVDKINFTSTKPSGWTVEFKPKELESVAALDYTTVEVIVKPPPETIAGDYQISIRASGTQATAQEMQIRVTVETPTLWGWIGVAIIAVVIGGLIFIFMRFSRR